MTEEEYFRTMNLARVRVARAALADVAISTAAVYGVNSYDMEEVMGHLDRWEQSLDRTNPQRAPVRVGCDVCGGLLTLIRGRHPGEDKREVCPTCLQERLERIHDETSTDYGKAFQAIA